MSRRWHRICAARMRYFRAWRKNDCPRAFERWRLAHRVLERMEGR